MHLRVAAAWRRWEYLSLEPIQPGVAISASRRRQNPTLFTSLGGEGHEVQAARLHQPSHKCNEAGKKNKQLDFLPSKIGAGPREAFGHLVHGGRPFNLSDGGQKTQANLNQFFLKVHDA